jgi:hypothetical protein
MNDFDASIARTIGGQALWLIARLDRTFAGELDASGIAQLASNNVGNLHGPRSR